MNIPTTVRSSRLCLVAECTSKSLPVPHPYPIHRTAGTNKFGCIWLEVRSPPSAWGWTHLELHLYHYMICRLRPYRTAFGSRVLASACAPRIESAFADHPALFAVSTAVRNECSVQPPAHLAQPPTAGALEVGDRPDSPGLPENVQLISNDGVTASKAAKWVWEAYQTCVKS